MPELAQSCRARTSIVQRARQVLERQGAHWTAESCKHARLGAFNVDLDEGGHPESFDQRIHGRGLNLDSAVPLPARENPLTGTSLPPPPPKPAHARGALPDEHRRSSPAA